MKKNIFRIMMILAVCMMFNAIPVYADNNETDEWYEDQEDFEEDDEESGLV